MIERYFRAGYVFLSVETTEEPRFNAEMLLELPGILERLKKGNADAELDVWHWDVTGVKFYHEVHVDNGQVKFRGNEANPELRDAFDLLNKLGETDKSVILVMADVDFSNDPGSVRLLKNLRPRMEQHHQMVVFLQVRRKLPDNIQPWVTNVEFRLPDVVQLNRVYSAMKVNLNLSFTAEDDKIIVSAGQGLGRHDFENAIMLAAQAASDHEDNATSARFAENVFMEKVNRLEDQQITYRPARRGFKQIGGLSNLKDWIGSRRILDSEAAKQFNLPEPKGVLLTGIRGCGKTACGEAIAAAMNRPLFLLDVGALFGGIVGESEANTRRVIQIFDSIGPCVLMIDEIEKGLGKSGGNDGGTTARVMASLLTWLSTKTSPTFVIGTCNDIHALPPEMLRKGRFDEVFFVDLPTEAERIDIIEVMLMRYNALSLCPEMLTTELLAPVAKASLDYTGAELEQLVIDTLVDHLRMTSSTQSFLARLTAKAKNTKPQARINPDYVKTVRALAGDGMVKASGDHNESGMADLQKRTLLT